VWFDEGLCDSFSFGSVVVRQGDLQSDVLHGLSVSPRHVFQAMHQFHSEVEKVRWASPALEARKAQPGQTTWVTRVTYQHGLQELRLADKHGRCVARLIPQPGYLQPGPQTEDFLFSSGMS